MRILFLDQYADFGGAQLCLLDLLPAIRERGWKAHLALAADGPLVKAASPHCETVDILPGCELSAGRKSARDVLRFAGRFAGMARALSAIARRHAPDLIYVNGPRLVPAAAWVARDRCPLLFHCHSRISGRPAAALVRRSLKYGHASVIGCCAYALAAVAGNNGGRVVYNGVGEISRKRAVFAANGVWRIGMLGRIAPEKGQLEFVQAARRLLEEIPNCRFTICGAALFGDANAEAYARRVKEAAAGLPVAFVGWQENPGAVLAGFDLLVVPSIREPATTRVILEAYSAGVPVIAFASGGIPEVIRDGETGFLVEPRTPEALALKMRELILGPRHELERLAAAGREAWFQHYTLDRYRAEVLSAIEDAVFRNHPAVIATAASDRNR